MTEKDIKANLNKKVIYNKPIDNMRCECILTGGIIRRNKNGFYYQAELQLIGSSCILYGRLEDIEIIKGET